jgi:hypothetical protein
MGTKNNPGKFDCYQDAAPDEPMFVLLARDRDAPDLIREWANRREGRNGNPDKIAEARSCAKAMDRWRTERLTKTECCDEPISGKQRFCPRCGYEARTIP